MAEWRNETPGSEGNHGDQDDDADPFADPPYRDVDAPRNLVREHYPPYLNDRPDVVLDFKRRRKPRIKA